MNDSEQLCLVELKKSFAPRLIEFVEQHGIQLVPAIGYFTLGHREEGRLVNDRAIGLSLDPGPYPNYELANELGHFWPTSWVLHHFTTPLFSKPLRTKLHQFLYSGCELWHWFAGWLILLKLRLPQDGYWPLARAVIGHYTAPMDMRARRLAHWLAGASQALEAAESRYGAMPRVVLNARHWLRENGKEPRR